MWPAGRGLAGPVLNVSSITGVINYKKQHITTLNDVGINEHCEKRVSASRSNVIDHRLVAERLRRLYIGALDIRWICMSRPHYYV